MNLLEPEVLAEVTIVVRLRDGQAETYTSKLPADPARRQQIAQRVLEQAIALAKTCGLGVEIKAP